MAWNKQLIIAIPARGGSKRVPHKNIYPLKGKPLLCHTLDLIQLADLKISTYVSTDDPVIAEIANQYDFVDVVTRPENLSRDNSSTEDVLIHILDILKDRKQYPEWVITLPPTSPFRTVSTLLKFINFAKECSESIDCIMSVTENRGDFWKMGEGGVLARLFPDAPRRQQERVPLYEENSAIYITRVKSLRATGSILGKQTLGLPISSSESFDINTLEDIKAAERA